MDDVYQHPVFFECHNLQEEHRRTIEIYFRNRRKSGGGECGPLRRVRDDIYCIAFRHPNDQHRVLQRPNHELKAASLVFTVQSSVESHSPSTSTTPGEASTTSSQEPTQSPQSVCTLTPTPSDEEYELQPDTYLLRYLNECPKAWDDLQKELTTVASSAQIYPEEGRVLVRSLAQHAAEDEVRKWKSEVDKLFNGYMCHYEVDTHKVKALLQSCSHQTTDEVKVYSDTGMAVVVGKCSQVNARLMDLQNSTVKCRCNLVLERTVSNMSPHFMAFLRKAYGGPRMLCDFLGIDDEVEVELRDTELRFFSLSAHKLDDAENTLQGEFKEVKLDVPNCFAVLPELQEKLKSKTDYMNQGQCRVQVVFMSDSTVCLLGHTKEVEELSETVTQFIFDQPHKLPGLPSKEDTTVASYSLSDGLQVLVCQGDITKQDADALVNAANEDMDHCGGVAAALSKAGGPEVQMESKALVKQIGKIPTGDVVMTTGGNLKCKKLLHVVGPVGGKAGGREKFLLEKTVKSALNLAEMLEFNSIAIPCISSGVFGVPVTVCSEAIVTAVKEFSSQGGRSLSRIILIDNRQEVVRAMHEACDRLLQEMSTGNCTPINLGIHSAAAAQDTARGATAGANGSGVHVEISEGTIETQEVDAIVSPMVGHDPLSTRVGNTLFKIVGRQLTERFREEAEDESIPGDNVLVDGLSGLPFNAAFFLNLIPWDEDEDGTAVQVLRLGINNVLASCEHRGFRSVALPVLGSGIALRFPDHVAARVLLEEIHEFKQSRVSRTPFLVRVIIHPDDKESSEVFDLAQEAFTKDVNQPNQESTTKRIVLLGKTGSGKSSLANTLFGENLFTTNHSPNSGTKECQAETRLVNGRSITLIDTPGLFDAERSEEDVKPEIVNCITECSPGPHAFLIVLKVDKFTEQEKAVITKICEYFSEDALKYAVIVFTHGEQLSKGMKIEDFVSQNKSLSDLVQKCGGRCHVFDNKYWKNTQQNNYRSNQFQVEELLNTIDKMVMENNGGYYTNKVLQVVEEEIKKEEEHIKLSSGNMQLDQIRTKAKFTVSQRFLIQMTGTATGVLLGAFFGATEMIRLVLKVFTNPPAIIRQIKSIPPVGKALVATTAGGEVATATGVVTLAAAVTGGVLGGVIGHDAAEGAETVQEAMEMATKAVMEKKNTTLKRISWFS